ncbi:glycerophosphoryl diester phosphodiesterase [Pantoea ananatis]|nr:glycerophosphoryl diester phosphodiesterase [Pantoea ananatis]
MFNFHQSSDGIVLANGHRGYSSQYPENTLLAFEGARLAGMSSVELDVHMTRDEKMVVLHDYHIGRVSDGSGYVESMALDELKAFNFGAHSLPEGMVNIAIPVLDEIFDWAIRHNTGLIVETKQRSRLDRFVEKFSELVNTKPGIVDRMQLLGFNHVLLNRVKERVPGLMLQTVSLERYNCQLDAILSSNADCVCVEYDHAHIDDLRAYKQAGLGVRLYLPPGKFGLNSMDYFSYKFGHDVRSEILFWMKEGLIDMLSHDDVLYAKRLIEEAGLKCA